MALLAPSSATTLAPPSFEELITEAEIILRGVVTEVRAEEFNAGKSRGIRSLITLRVERALKGPATDAITLVQLGGVVRGRSLQVAGVPQFRRGERQVVFVAGNGRIFCPVVGGRLGRFLVQTDAATGREHVLRDDSTALVTVDQVPLPLGALPISSSRLSTAMALADFESRIRALVAPTPAKLLAP